MLIFGLFLCVCDRVGVCLCALYVCSDMQPIRALLRGPCCCSHLRLLHRAQSRGRHGGDGTKSGHNRALHNKAANGAGGAAAVRVGDEASAAVTFTSDDVETFARLTGDHNPIHMSAAGAAAAG
jgi:hypothetical protein